MNVLMLTTQLGYGGAERAFLRAAAGLARRHHVEIAVFTADYGEGAYDLSVPRTDLPVHQLDHRPYANRLARWLARWRRIRALKRRLKIDVTISFLTGPNVLNAVSGGRDRTIISYRGSRRYDVNGTARQRRAYRWIADPIALGLADRVVAVSEGVAREIAGRPAGALPGHYRVIPPCIPSRDFTARNEPPPTLPWIADHKVIVTAGRLSREKGIQDLILIFAQVRERLAQARLVIIGDGPALSQLHDLCWALGLSFGDGSQDADVSFLGYRAKPHLYYEAFDLFVLASRSEGFCNALLEALATGIEIVAGDVPWGPRELLSGAPDPLNRPFFRTEPQQTPLGTLMPPAGDPANRTLWVETLVERLSAAKAEAGLVEQRRRRAAEFDCDLVADQWHALLEVSR